MAPEISVTLEEKSLTLEDCHCIAPVLPLRVRVLLLDPGHKGLPPPPETVPPTDAFMVPDNEMFWVEALVLVHAKVPDFAPAVNPDWVRTKTVELETIPSEEGVKLMADANVVLSFETSKPTGAVTVMLVVKLMPETVKDWLLEGPEPKQ